MGYAIVCGDCGHESYAGNQRGDRLKDRKCPACGGAYKRKYGSVAGSKRWHCHICDRLTEFVAPERATTSESYVREAWPKASGFVRDMNFKGPGEPTCRRHWLRDAVGNLVGVVRPGDDPYASREREPSPTEVALGEVMRTLQAPPG